MLVLNWLKYYKLYEQDEREPEWWFSHLSNIRTALISWQLNEKSWKYEWNKIGLTKMLALKKASPLSLKVVAVSKYEGCT